MYRHFWDYYGKYHQRKEEMVWLASSVYFAFAIAVLKWAHKNAGAWVGRHIWFQIGLSLVFILATAFVWKQNEYKIDAAAIIRELRGFLSGFDSKTPPTFADLRRQLEDKKLCFRQKWARRRKEGCPGLIIVLLMIVVIVAQQLLLCWWSS